MSKKGKRAISCFSGVGNDDNDDDGKVKSNGCDVRIFEYAKRKFTIGCFSSNGGGGVKKVKSNGRDVRILEYAKRKFRISFRRDDGMHDKFLSKSPWVVAMPSGEMIRATPDAVFLDNSTNNIWVKLTLVGKPGGMLVGDIVGAKLTVDHPWCLDTPKLMMHPYRA